MARRIFAPLVLVALVFATIAATRDASFHYVDPHRVDLTVLLPPPPDAGSAQQRSDQEQVASAVAARSPSRLFYAQEESQRDVFVYARSVGQGFTPERFPVTARFFERIGSDVAKLVDLAKAYWVRPRPDGATRKRGSYPSGHAAFAACTAILLSEMVPEKRGELFARSAIFAESRIIAGVHYPSDVEAGWISGTVIAQALMSQPKFQTDFAAAKAEVRRTLGLP